jgi:hypothetical protein
MVNLVFTHALKTKVFSNVFTTLPEIIRILYSAQFIHVICLRCPILIRTRWVDLVDVLAFLLDCFADVQTP